MFHHILVPTDGSPLSTVAVEKAIEFAGDAGAKVTVLTAISPFRAFSVDADQVSDTRAEYERRAYMHAAEILSDARRKAKARGVSCDVIRHVRSLQYPGRISERIASLLMSIKPGARTTVSSIMLMRSAAASDRGVGMVNQSEAFSTSRPD